MTLHKVLGLAGLVAVGAASPALAQSPPDGPGVVISAQGGGLNALGNLDVANNVDFKTGFNVGGSVGYLFNRFVAVRGNVTFARADARDAILRAGSIGGTTFNRYYYDVDFQVRAPLGGGVTPYLSVGGGGVTVKPDVAPNQPAFTKGAGKVSAGLSFEIPHSNAAIHVEGTSRIYQWDQLGFNKTQVDLTWSGGVSYRFGR
jgi:hypothetical protein